MNSLEQRRKQILTELQSLSRQIDEMDGKIRAYLADRQHKPHPRHLEFIEKIQGYRIDSGVATRQMSTLLDNLQWKVYYSKRAWAQLWENAEAQRRTNAPHEAVITESAGPATTPEAPDAENSSRGQYSVDTLWEIQKEKHRVHGSPSGKETKTEFKKRMLKEYQKLNGQRKKNQEIVLSFDKDTRQCRLTLKD